MQQWEKVRSLASSSLRGEAMDVATLANKPPQTVEAEDEASVEISRLQLFKLLAQVVGRQTG